MFVSISAGKLLPYQDYLLYKPSSSLMTKAYFQRRNNDDGTESSSRDDEISVATRDEESDIIANNPNASCSLPAACGDDVLGAVLEISGECCGESVLQNTDLSPVKLSSPRLTTDTANEISEISASHTDYDQMSVENRKRVSEFFSHSRLHHIATWGAEYKAYVTQLRSQVI